MLFVVVRKSVRGEQRWLLERRVRGCKTQSSDARWNWEKAIIDTCYVDVGALLLLLLFVFFFLFCLVGGSCKSTIVQKFGGDQRENFAVMKLYKEGL